MFFEYFREDKNVVQVANREFVKEGLYRIVNNRLESGGRICQSKWYNEVFKVPI
jgi:hypothetical protein